MVLTDETTAMLMPLGGYTSCIKINGNPILPPLITESKRLEIQNYKKQAINIERRLKSQLLFIDTSLKIKEPFKNNSNTTLEHFLSFSNDNSHINALGISNISKKLPSQDCKTLVPLKKPKSTNLSCNIFDVSEYSDNGVVIFKQYNQNDSNEQEGQLSASTVELDLSDTNSAGDPNIDEVPGDFFLHETTLSLDKDFLSSTILLNTLEESKPKPRLIRSNSYTLESPSPVLVEHFKKQAEQDPNSFAKPPQRRSLDLGNCSHSPISIPPPTKSIFTPHRINNNTTKNSSDNIGNLVQDLAQKHFGEVESKIIEPEANNDDTFSLNSRVEEVEAELHEVLSGMPEDYAKDIMEFLERHQNEQEIKFKSYDTFKQRLFEQNVNLETIMNIDVPRTENIKEQPQYMEFDPLSPSPRDKIEKQLSDVSEIKVLSCDSHGASSPTDTFNAFNTSTPLLIDFESDSCDNEPSVHFELNSTFSNSDPLHVLRGYEDYLHLADDVPENKSANCSRELFPENPAKRERKLKEQWAATVLTAAAKGFLVRRLKRTERVKNLIQTIQDALVCAMSLHTESTESIHPPDVELHRRLIQQVSAACFEFYEIFFNMTTKDQMALIALDRQRIKEKLKRPKSTSSLKLDSRKSTPNSQRHSFNNIRQKKTLTPSFAA